MQNKDTYPARTEKSNALCNEKGIALAMILVLSVIVLAVMAGLVYMVTTSSQLSGMQKRYQTSLEAGKGGADVVYQLIVARADPGIPLTNFLITATTACLADKLNKKTSSWDPACDKSMSIDSSSHDVHFDLGTSPNVYRVYAKIVDTVEGNSGGDEGLLGKGVVNSGSGEVAVVSRPYLYTIEIESERTNNPSERAKLSILYQY
jgi:hypothetical protein